MKISRRMATSCAVVIAFNSVSAGPPPVVEKGPVSPEEALGMVGMDVARNFSIGLGYRAIGTDYASGDFGYDVVSHGPIFGGELRF